MLKLQTEDLMYRLTRNLRKHCDSKPTSILWNLIFLMDRSQDRRFIAATTGAVENANTIEDLQGAWVELLRLEINAGEYLLTAALCAIELMTQKDINGIFSGILTEGEVDVHQEIDVVQPGETVVNVRLGNVG